jgi:D-sedoheptulose 7-phosphate isomerase
MKQNWEEIVFQDIEESKRVKEGLDREKILEIAEIIFNSLKKGGKLILFGNGGSAADAQHIAAEFVGRFNRERGPLPAIALTTDTSILTALGNDYGIEEIFSRQVESLVEERDVVIGISTSGNSINVIKGIKKAKEKKALTIGLTGITGGKLKEEVDKWLPVPSTSTPRIQEAHITIGHILCHLIEESLFGVNY